MSQALRDRVEELTEENRQLRAIFSNKHAYEGFSLTPLRAAILTVLERHSGTSEEIAEAVSFILERDVSAQTIRVTLWRMRRNPAMTQLSRLISSQHRVGFWMTDENKARSRILRKGGVCGGDEVSHL